MLNKTVQFNTTDDDATTPSSITTFVHDTSTAGTPTPTNPDLDEKVHDVLSHIFGEAHTDGESDKLIASQCHETGNESAPQVVTTESSGYSCSGST
jgi:hypothetical protein